MTSMMRRCLAPATVAILTLAPCLAADAASSQPAKPAAAAPSAAAAPAPKAAETAGMDHIQVQHILIGFTGSVPGKNITRSKEEAEKLANDVLARAKKGEDFDALVKEYTADSAPGIYGIANSGVTPAQGEIARNRMVKGFGDTSFSLQPGEIGMASYDPKASPYGWHIVKRLK